MIWIKVMLRKVSQIKNKRMGTTRNSSPYSEKNIFAFRDLDAENVLTFPPSAGE